MKSKLDSIRDWRLRAARHGYRLCVMAEAEGVSRCWLGTYLKMKFGRPAHALLAEHHRAVMVYNIDAMLP